MTVVMVMMMTMMTVVMVMVMRKQTERSGMFCMLCMLVLVLGVGISMADTTIGRIYLNNSLSQNSPVYSGGQSQSQVEEFCVPPFSQIFGTQSRV